MNTTKLKRLLNPKHLAKRKHQRFKRGREEKIEENFSRFVTNEIDIYNTIEECQNIDYQHFKPNLSVEELKQKKEKCLSSDIKFAPAQSTKVTAIINNFITARKHCKLYMEQKANEIGWSEIPNISVNPIMSGSNSEQIVAGTHEWEKILYKISIMYMEE